MKTFNLNNSVLLLNKIYAGKETFQMYTYIKNNIPNIFFHVVCAYIQIMHTYFTLCIYIFKLYIHIYGDIN